jgi:replication factor C subunit 1
MLVRRLEVDGKDALDDIYDLMDSYYLTREDWDAIIELGVGPMGEESVQIPTQTRSAFTRG